MRTLLIGMALLALSSLHSITLGLGIAFAEIPPPALINIEVGDSHAVIEWERVKEAVGYNVYLKESAGNFLLLNDIPIIEMHVELVDLANGMPYFFAVTSIGTGGEESDAVITSMVVPLGYSHSAIRLEGGSGGSDYQVFSTPFIPDMQRPEDFFAYLGEYNGKRWRLFSLEKDGFIEFGKIEKIEPGKAYWFLSMEDMDIFLSGRTVNSYDPFFVRLSPGWNVIASPFLYPVNWGDVLASNSNFVQDIGKVLWEFNRGSFTRAQSLQPYKGYFVYSSYETDFNLLIPPVPAKPRTVLETASQVFTPSEKKEPNPSELLKKRKTQSGNTDISAESNYSLMVGLFSDQLEAHQMVEKLEKIGLSPSAHNTEIRLKRLKIREGNYNNPESVRRVADLLKGYGFEPEIATLANGGYSVEVGSFKSGAQAEKAVKFLEGKGLDVRLEAGWETATASEVWLENIRGEKELDSVKNILKKERISFFAKKQ